MRPGKMYKSGDVVLTEIQFTDSLEVKKRPAVVLFEYLDNVVLAGVTSNINMKGIPITKEEGAIENSVIKLNYIFTVASMLIEKKLFSLSKQKKKVVFEKLNEFLRGLVS